MKGFAGRLLGVALWDSTWEVGTLELIRNLLRRKLRSILTILGIFIGILALTVMGSMAEHFNKLLDGGVTYFGSSIQVADSKSGGGAFGGGAVLTLAKLDEIRKVGGVQAVSPSVGLSAKPGSVNTVSFGIPDFITNSDPNLRYSKFKTSYVSGHDVDPSGRGEVVLGSTFAQEFRKTVGDSITLPVRPSDAGPDFVNHSFKVVGVLNSTLTEPDTGAFVSLHDAQTLLGESLPPAIRSVIDPYTLSEGGVVYGKPGVDLDKLADKINKDVPAVKATKPTTIVNSFKAGGAIFTFITTAAALLA